MREIKFRAWHKIEKKMYQVAGIHHILQPDEDYHEPEMPISEEIQQVFLVKDLPTCEKVSWVDAKEIELLQFTGLVDKNGKEIYEGYIIRCYDGFIESYFNSVVEWEINDIQDDINTFPLHVSGFIIGSLGEVEVIGNIYENSELVR